MHVMIFGCGYSGTAIAKVFAGDGVRVSGTTRSPDKVEALRRNGIEAFLSTARAWMRSCAGR